MSRRDILPNRTHKRLSFSIQATTTTHCFKVSDWLVSTVAHGSPIVFRRAVGIFIPPLLANSCASEQKKREPGQIALAVTCWNLFCRFYRWGLSKHHTSAHLVWANSKKSSAALVAKSLFPTLAVLARSQCQRRLCKLQYQCKITATLIVRVCVREREPFFL